MPVEPVGLAYVAASLRSAGRVVEFLDLCFVEDRKTAVSDAIARSRPDVIGISLRNVDLMAYFNPLSFVGELGEIVVTPLFNFAMPLLRYRLEDLGRWASAPCPCGRTWPQLAEVTGRRIDVFVTRGGELVSGGLFIKIVEHVNYDHGDFIEKYQIVQEDFDHVRILLKLFEGDRASAHEAALQEVRDNVAHVVGPGVRLDFEFPADIEPSPSGKYRFTVSKVARSSAQHSDLFET